VIVQGESDPAELASADQGDEEPEKQPTDTTATEQQKEDSYACLCFSVSPCGYDAFVSFGFGDNSTMGVVTTQEGMFCHLRE